MISSLWQCIALAMSQQRQIHLRPILQSWRVQRTVKFLIPYGKGPFFEINWQRCYLRTEAFHYSSLKKHKDGSVVIHIPEVEEYKILNFVLTWAGEAQILAPNELISKVSLSANQILNLHKLKK